jgi:hypothetical protein
MILRQAIAGPDYSNSMPLLPEATFYAPTQLEIERVNELAAEAVVAGRMIDFGHLPNSVLQHGGTRGGPLWQQGAIDQPFSEPWVFLHSWEGGVAVYLVNPTGKGDIEAAELQPAIIGGMKFLLLADRGLFIREHELKAKKYFATMAPSMIRFVADPELRAKANQGGLPQTAAAGNVGDPVMAALLILSTRNLQRETIRAPEKLQRARMKSGKKPIPPHDRVLTAPYVTALSMRGRRERGEDLGGHHASPVPHIRMGHPREYSSGRTIFIHDTLVNVPEEQRAAFKSKRSHYTVKR